MRIKKIQLVKFKRFSDLTIDLGDNPKKIVALVGPNGCGKSSIFDAFEEKAKDYKGGAGSIDFFSKSQFMGEPTQYNKNEQIKIYFLNDKQPQKTSYYIRSSYRFSSKINSDQIKGLPRIEDDGNRPQTSIDLDSRMQENYDRLIGGFFGEVYDKDKTGKQWADENVAKLNRILEKILDIKVSWLGNPVEGKGKLYFEKGVAKKFPYDNLSSGEKEVVDLIVDLIIKTSSFQDTVFCIDEPELHINTSIQRTMLTELEKLIPDTCQLWVATHSVGFIRALTKDLADKCQIIDMGDSDFDSEIILKPIVVNRLNLKKLFDTALDDLAGLISPKIIIYCEGKKETEDTEQGIDAIIYNNIFNSVYPDILFVSSGGGTEPRKFSEVALSVLQKAFIDTKIYYLKDRGGKEDFLTDKDRSDQLSAHPSKLILKRREIENYLFDPEILRHQKSDLDLSRLAEIDWKLDYLKPKYQDIKTIVDFKDTPYKLMEKLSEFVSPSTNIFKELEQDIGIKNL